MLQMGPTMLQSRNLIAVILIKNRNLIKNANCCNTYIHSGLDKSLFSFGDYKEFLNTIDKFLSEQLRAEFKIVDPPKLVISTKWKHDYIICSRSY